jgi:hypothetical protein
MDGLTTGEGGIEGPHSWGVIVDEPSIGTFIETVNITNSTLTKAINRADSEPFRKLLEVVRNTIETACNGGQKPVHIVGQTAFDLVMDTAKKASYDLPELVAGAREVVDQDKAPHVRVEFEVMIDISKNGKSILMRIDGNEIWLPVSEIELDEAAKTVTMPKWLAAKHNLSESIPLDEIDVAAEVEESKSELLLNFADDLVACLEADLKKKAPFNSSLVITKIAKSPTLRLNLKRSFNHVTGPVVMLDAFAEPELLSALTGRKVKQWRVPLKMASDEVIQVIDGQYGITTLWNKSENAPKKAVMRLMKAVNRITTGKESETLIVTWKALAQYLIALQQQGEFDSRAAIAWYGAIEGINTYEDRTQAILIGTPSPQKDDIIEMGQAIWANDPKLLNTEVRQVWRRYAYKDANGNGKEAKIWEFEDERLNMILRTYREYEMIQAAHRIRPLLTAGKLIYLLSSLPIEELPPTRLTTLNELAGDAKPEGYDEFVVLVETLVNRYTGVWHGVFEMAKSSNLTLVINNISYNSAQIAKFLQMLSRDKCFRWLPKVAKQLGLVSTRLVFTKGLSLKVFYRSGQLDENKIRELYFRVFGQKS